jgi:hypothetical protein
MFRRPPLHKRSVCASRRKQTYFRCGFLLPTQTLSGHSRQPSSRRGNIVTARSLQQRTRIRFDRRAVSRATSRPLSTRRISWCSRRRYRHSVSSSWCSTLHRDEGPPAFCKKPPPGSGEVTYRTKRVSCIGKSGYRTTIEFRMELASPYGTEARRFIPPMWRLPAA